MTEHAPPAHATEISGQPPAPQDEDFWTSDMQGLRMTVLRLPQDDGTRQGITSHRRRLTVVGMVLRGRDCRRVVQPLDPRYRLRRPSRREPAVLLVRRVLDGAERWHVEPLNEFPEYRYAFGGNAAYSCDDAFRTIVGFDGPLFVHDRDESTDRAVYADHESAPGRWCPLSGTPASGYAANEQSGWCPGWHPAPVVSYLTYWHDDLNDRSRPL